MLVRRLAMCLALTFLWLLGSSTHAQEVPPELLTNDLAIDVPADGSVFALGSSVAVSVRSSGNFQGIQVVGENLGITLSHELLDIVREAVQNRLDFLLLGLHVLHLGSLLVLELL